MQYDLVFYPDQNAKEYILIKGFGNDSKLQGIINFCCNFENYDEIVHFLYQTGYITEPIENGVFKIHSRTSKDSKPKIFAKGIFYSNEKKFFDISFLQNFYAENVKNKEFMLPIINTHFNYIINRSTNAREHLYYIRHTLISLENYAHFIDEQNNCDLESHTRNFVTKFSTRNNANGTRTTHYPNLMLLARIAINFSRKIKNQNPDVASDDFYHKSETDIQNRKNLISHYKQLLSQLNPDDEEYSYYLSLINELESDLPIVLSRRIPNEATEN